MKLTYVWTRAHILYMHKQLMSVKTVNLRIAAAVAGETDGERLNFFAATNMQKFLLLKVVIPTSAILTTEQL